MPFFDVSSNEIVQRLVHSLIPFSPHFHPIFHSKPDLYGPFWILTTMIAMLFIVANLTRYIEVGRKEFEYNFTVIPFSAGVIYGVGLGLPTIVHSCQKWFGSGVRQARVTPLTSAIGIYGYSFSSFIVVTILCSIPINWL